jgi:hypothetical protein
MVLYVLTFIFLDSRQGKTKDSGPNGSICTTGGNMTGGKTRNA